MDDLIEISETLAGRGYAASRHLVRKVIHGKEFESKLLPPGMLNPDGSPNIYDDVRRLLNLVFENGHPAVQCKGIVGYIPLNDNFALEVSPKVPIGNLERLIGMAAGYSPNILNKYTRQFARADQRADTIFDILADQLVEAFDRIWDNGLLRTYKRVNQIGSSPSGRINSFASAWRAPAGAGTKLFYPFYVAGENPKMTPDIVIEVEGVTRLVIDVKYKQARLIPERPDTEQAITYGARYGCSQVMLVHAGRDADHAPVSQVGQIGSYLVLNGLIDLDAAIIEFEEQRFVEAVRARL